MISTKIENVTINHDNEGDVLNNTVSLPNKFKATLIIDNITHHMYKIYKITIDKNDDDTLLTIFSDVTKISCNILLPSNKKMLIIINDSFWL